MPQSVHTVHITPTPIDDQDNGDVMVPLPFHHKRPKASDYFTDFLSGNDPNDDKSSDASSNESTLNTVGHITLSPSHRPPSHCCLVSLQASSRDVANTWPRNKTLSTHHGSVPAQPSAGEVANTWLNNKTLSAHHGSVPAQPSAGDVANTWLNNETLSTRHGSVPAQPFTSDGVDTRRNETTLHTVGHITLSPLHRPLFLTSSLYHYSNRQVMMPLLG